MDFIRSTFTSSAPTPRSPGAFATLPAAASPASEPPPDAYLGALGARALPAAPSDSNDSMWTPAHRLSRPIIMVHGMGQQGDTWFNFKNFFCSNPDNRFGGVYQVAHESEFLAKLKETPAANVFAIDMSNNIGSPFQQAAELSRLIALVRSCTGAADVNLLTHSMGGIVARDYLRQGGDHVRNLIMLAPPNHGSAEADIALFSSELGLYDHYPQVNNGALVALQSEHTILGGERNPYLGQLDRAWEHDSKRVKATIITGVGVPTPERVWLPVTSGDGMVTPLSAKLENADFYIAQASSTLPGTPGFRDFESMRYNHLHIVSELTVMRKVDEILASDTPPAAPVAAPVERQLDLFPSQPQASA